MTRKSSDAISLRNLPAMHEILAEPLITARIPVFGRFAVLSAARHVLDQLRRAIQAENLKITRDELLCRAVQAILESLDHSELDNLSLVINATGILLHTGLGRAPLAPEAVKTLSEIAGNCNLEVDLHSGERRHRGFQVESAWQQLTGTEDSLVVNNNAAATLLTLQALCRGREVIISRGQLIEIGGSFRLPEIFSLSGSLLKEVGTTNRTHLSDYTDAIGPQTAAILHVHPSNYRIVGFSQTPSIAELVALGKQHGLLVIDDIGSGSLIDVTQFGLPAEPTFTDSLQAGADIVLGSGDKLLGGPQCGVILGCREHVNSIRKHPLARTVRPDKLTLGALSATLKLYCQGIAEQSIPILRMLKTPQQELLLRAHQIESAIHPNDSLEVEVRVDTAEVGGGVLPAFQLPTTVIAIRHSRDSADTLAARLRCSVPRVFGRIHKTAVLLDLRSVLPEQDGSLLQAVSGLIGND